MRCSDHSLTRWRIDGLIHSTRTIRRLDSFVDGLIPFHSIPFHSIPFHPVGRVAQETAHPLNEMGYQQALELQEAIRTAMTLGHADTKKMTPQVGVTVM